MAVTPLPAFAAPRVKVAKAPAKAAPRTLICDSQAVPGGWVITQRLSSWPPCGTNAGARWIEKLGAAQIAMCEGQDIPQNYPAVQFTTSTICGTWMAGPNNFQYWGAWIIRKIGASPMIICEDQPIPAGYRLTQKASSSICGSRYVGNNQWEMRGALMIEKF